RVGVVPIARARDLSREIAHHPPGSKVELIVRRGKETKVLGATLGALEQEGGGRSSRSNDAPAEKGALGIQIGDAEGGGAVVRGVLPDGPSAGVLRPGDVIVEVDRATVASADDLRAKVRAAAADK